MVERLIWGYSLISEAILAPFGKGVKYIIPKTFAVQNSIATYPHGINAKGAITGEYSDSGGAIHGFVGSPKSGFTSFDVPGGSETDPSSINDGGDIPGNYTSGGSIAGFIRTP
jgi:hypothetical protein